MKHSRVLTVLLAATVGSSILTVVGTVAAGGGPEVAGAVGSAFATLHRAFVPPPRVRLARSLRSANISRQVDRAIASGRYRLVGIAGIGLFFPGMEDHPSLESALTRRYGYLFVEGTSDASDGPDQSELQQAAYDYAKQYNTLLRQRLFGH